MNLPADGSKIRFTKVPTGSWAKEGETYQVSRRNKKTIRVENIDGAASFDPLWAYRAAEWSEA